MTSLREPRTKLSFETSATIHDGGQSRAIIVEAQPHYAVIRLKQTQQRLTLSWEGIYHFAAKAAAEQAKRDAWRPGAQKRGRR